MKYFRMNGPVTLESEGMRDVCKVAVYTVMGRVMEKSAAVASG
jgi:hypothetical protein